MSTGHMIVGPWAATSSRARLDALEDALACLESTQDRLIRGVFYTKGHEVKVRLLQRLSRVVRKTTELTRRIADAEQAIWDDSIDAEVKAFCREEN